MSVSQKLEFDSPAEHSRMGVSETCTSTSGLSTGATATASGAPAANGAHRSSITSRNSVAQLHGSFASAGGRPRASASSAALAALRASCGASSHAVSSMTSAYTPDVAKVLRDAVRCSEAAVLLRVLPKHQLLQQLVLQEQCQRELALAQETAARARVQSKMIEERSKLHEQQLARAHKAALDALKAQQQSELAAQRDSAAQQQRELEADVRERLRALASLQPRLPVLQAAVADAKQEFGSGGDAGGRQDGNHDGSNGGSGGGGGGSYALLGQLLEEERRWSRALRASARYGRSRTADTDGGALPYWYKDCVAASYNVAAICKHVPYRAVVRELAALPCKSASDRKVVMIIPVDATRDEAAMAAAAAAPLTYAHARCVASTDKGSAHAIALAEACAPLLTCGAECAGVLWPKDTLAELSRKTRGGGVADAEAFARVLRSSASALGYGGVSSHADMTAHDVQAYGDAAAASA